jgi:peroxiredoxin
LPLIDFRAYAIGKNLQEGMEYPKDGSIAPVHDFMLEDTQQDLAPELLEKEKLMLVILYNLNKSDAAGFPKIKEIAEKATQKGYTVYGVSASFSDDLLLAKEKYNLPFEFLFCDETTLKTMIRANPGVMILDKGTVTQKKNWTDVDEIEL